MALPVFFSAEITEERDEHMLNEETSKHIVQVLRMKQDDEVNVSNGNGYMFLTKIIEAHKKSVTVQILSSDFQASPPRISIGISLVKNAQRFEWFLEKAVEIGISEVYPLICARTERQQFRQARMQGIMISAMLQSQQAWLPRLHEPITFQQFIEKPLPGNAFIAHCLVNEERKSLQHFVPLKDPVILIGPEGDFTQDEIVRAMQMKYKPVTLGNTRLRTETAGMVAVTLLNNLSERLPD